MRVSLYLHPESLEVDVAKDIWWRADDSQVIAAVYFADHIVPIFSDAEAGFVMDAWSLVAAAAVDTRHIGVGVLVSPLRLRGVNRLAQLAVTAQLLSSGRATVGVGVGWFEPELERLGIADTFSSLMNDFAADVSDFVAELNRAAGAAGVPPPRIAVGGNSKRFILPAAADFADIWTGGEPLDAFTAHCKALADMRHVRGVRADPLATSILMYREISSREMRRLGDLGIDELVVTVDSVEAAERVVDGATDL